MYTIKNIAILLFIIIGACSFTLALTSSAVAAHIKDHIIINNGTEIVPAITEINSPSIGPQPPVTVSPNTTTAVPNTNTTTGPTTTSTTPTTPTTPTTHTTLTTPTTATTPTTPTIKPTPNTTTTISPNVTTSTPVTTVIPTAIPTTTRAPSHRGFDGPSFIGGIVLALGLVAIGFVAFKFYKARTELNYHTL